MSLFACDICGCVENTALAGYRGYHGRNMPLCDAEFAEHPDWAEAGLGDGKARCSGCNPEVGRWHGHFKQLPYSPAAQTVVNR